MVQSVQVAIETDNASDGEGTRDDDRSVVWFADGFGLILVRSEGWSEVWRDFGARVGSVCFAFFVCVCACGLRR